MSPEAFRGLWEIRGFVQSGGGGGGGQLHEILAGWLVVEIKKEQQTN